MIGQSSRVATQAIHHASIERTAALASFRRYRSDRSGKGGSSQRCISSSSAIPQSHSRSKPIAFAFDIDGVLKAGETPLPGAKRALRMLRGENRWKVKIPHVFVTNGGGISEKERAKKLSNDFDMPIMHNHVIQAHTVLQSLALQYGKLPVLVVGGPQTPETRKIMAGYGFEDVYTTDDIHAWQASSWPFWKPRKEEEAQAINIRQTDFSKVQFAAILVFHDSRDWGCDIQYICDILRSPDRTLGKVGDDAHEQPFLAFSHGDLVWSNEFSAPRLGQGAFQTAVRAVYEQLSGRPLKATTFGKPQKLTHEYASTMLQLQNEEDFKKGQSVWMIGDNPASDIHFANQWGWKSALVETGVYRRHHGDPAHKPTLIVKDVESAVIEAIKQEWGETPL